MIQGIEVFSSAYAFQEEDLRGKTAVIIDVLRASSTIVTAISNGAKGVIPVEDMGSASKISQSLDSPHYLLCGEKDGKKIDGYALGNSPLEYSAETVQNKTIILNTTNGTKAIKRSLLADEIIVGCFLNLEAIVEALRHSENELVLVCSGWHGRLALEDLLCAGNIIYELTQGTLPDDARDGAKVAFGLFEKFGNNVYETISHSNHAVRLEGIVGHEDVEFCCQVSKFNILPTLTDGIISTINGKKK